MRPLSETTLLWLLRVAVSMEFIGHGAFGIIGKSAWVPYFGVVGIPEPWAWELMPLVGTLDILLGVSGLLRPCRAVLLYMTVWGLWTALLRPLSGESIWEMIERAGNFGVPLAFLAASQARRWHGPLELRPMDEVLRRRLSWILRLTIMALLVGHGAFDAVLRKQQLQHHLASIDLPLVPITALGGFEIALGLAVLLDPAAPLLLFVAAWKISTELLYPISGAPFWEFIERGASYAAPLALFLLVFQSTRRGNQPDAHPASTGRLAELMQ